MGDKVTPTTLTTLENSSTARTLNNNLDLLADEFDEVIYRDGTQDMQAHLNMGSNRLINVGSPVDPTDALRLQDLMDFNEDGVIEVESQFTQIGTAATPRAMTNKFQDLPITPYDWGAVGNGVADDTAEVQAALTAAIQQGRVFDLAYGTFKVTSTISASGHVRIMNSGGGRLVAASGTFTGAVVELSGSAVQVEALNASVSKGAVAFTAVSSSSFSAGDWGTFYDPTNYSFATFNVAAGYGDDRETYRKGEFFEVLTASGANVTVHSPFYDTYGSGPTDVYKVTPLTGYVRDIIIEAGGFAYAAMKVDYGFNFEIVRPKLRNTQVDALVTSRCFNLTVSEADLVNIGAGSDDYGWSISSCQNVRTSGAGRAYGRRHGVSMGNSDQVNCVPNRNCVVSDMLITNDRASGIGAADIHGCSENCGFDRCALPNGANVGGRSPFVLRSDIQSVTSGIAILTYELIGGTVDFRFNNITCHANPTATSKGAVEIGGVASGLVSPLNIRVSGNTFNSTVFTNSTRIVVVQNHGATVAINPDVTDNDLLGVNEFGSMLYMRLNTGTAASNRIRVRRNSTSLTGKFALVDGGVGGNTNAYANLSVLCMPEQTLKASFTTDTGVSNQVSSVISFKWQYPRTPTLTVGGADRTYVGTKAVVTSSASLSASSGRLVIATPDNSNWASALAVNVSAIVSLEEV